MSREPGGLALSKRQTLREMAVVIDTIELLCLNSKTKDDCKQTVNAVQIIITELGKSLRGERPLLETSDTVGSMQIMIQNDLKEESLH